MKNLAQVNQINLTELSFLEQQEIQGGDMTIKFDDDKGYTWYYTYNDKGDLTGIQVVGANCIY